MFSLPKKYSAGLLLLAVVSEAADYGGVGVCNQRWCTSPSLVEGVNDCFAGSEHEPCTCSQGKAKMTETTVQHEGRTYYEYTCCSGGSEEGLVGEECGDCCTDGAAGFVGFLIIVCVIATISTIIGVCICKACKCCCFQERAQQGQGAVPNQFAPQMAQATVVGQPVLAQPVQCQPAQATVVQAIPVQGTVVQGNVMET